MIILKDIHAKGNKDLVLNAWQQHQITEEIKRLLERQGWEFKLEVK